MPDYGAYRFTRVAGPTPDAPDVYSPVKDGWVSPGHFQNTERPIWSPLPATTGQAYAKAATYGEQIRAELAANDPALLVLDREFETQSVDPMFLEPECGLAWYDAGRKNLELVLGVQSPYEAAESVAYLLGKAHAAFKPARINAHFAYMRRRLRRTRPHAVSALCRAGGDVLPGSPGPARPRPLSAVPRRHQAARLQDAHADRGRSRERQDHAFAADQCLDGGGLANFSVNVATVGADCRDRHLRYSESRRHHGGAALARRDRGVDARLRNATDDDGAGSADRRESRRRCRSTRSSSGAAMRSRPAAGP